MSNLVCIEQASWGLILFDNSLTGYVAVISSPNKWMNISINPNIIREGLKIFNITDGGRGSYSKYLQLRRTTK